jgi:hypothetical protein
VRNDDWVVAPGHAMVHPPNVGITPESAAALIALRRLFSDEIPDVDVGQLWRAEWDSVTVLGVTLAIEDGYTEFAPVTADIDYADPFTAILPMALSPLPIAVAVFTSLTTPVPVYVLEANLGRLAPGVVADLTSIWHDSLAGRAPQSAFKLGGGSADALEARITFRHELLHELGVLASTQLMRDTAEGLSLKALPIDSDIRPSQIMQFLDVGLPDARAISTGTMPLTAKQAERLVSQIGCAGPDALRLTVVTVPRELIEALDSPRRFSVVRRISSRRNLDCVDAIGYIPAVAAARTQHTQSVATHTRQYWEDLLETLAATYAAQ